MANAKGTGADIFLEPDTQGVFSFSTGQLPQKFVEFLQKQPHVKAAVAVLMIPVELITGLQTGRIIEIPQLGGLHHRYERLAA